MTKPNPAPAIPREGAPLNEAERELVEKYRGWAATGETMATTNAGVFLTYEEYNRLQALGASRSSLPGAPSDKAVWLIERSQPEKQSPPMWWETYTPGKGDVWTEAANRARWFQSKAEALRFLEDLGWESVHNWGHVSEHIFINRHDAGAPSDTLTAGEAAMCLRALHGQPIYLTDSCIETGKVLEAKLKDWMFSND